MNFHHLLERHQQARTMFDTVKQWLAEAKLLMTRATLVDATIIQAPSSPKNKDKARDQDRHQTRKSNRCYFGMNADIGVDGDKPSIAVSALAPRGWSWRCHEAFVP